MVKFQCPCGKKLGVPDEHEGRKVKCPKCGAVVVARREESVAAAAAPDPAPAPSMLPSDELLEELLAPAPPRPRPAPIPQPPQAPVVVSARPRVPAVPPQAAVYVPGHPQQPVFHQAVVQVPRHKGTSGFGVAALVVGIVGVLFCWVPFVGLLAIPLGLIAGLLAVIGIIVSLAGGRSGVGLPVAGGVVALLAVVVPVLMTGAIASSMSNARVNAARNARAGASTPTSRGGAAVGTSSASEWAPANEGVTVGDVHVSVTASHVGMVPVTAIGGRATTSKDPQLMIRVELKNQSETRKITYLGWAGLDFSFGRDYVTLRDNFGNVYKQVIAVGRDVNGQVKAVSIRPGESQLDVLVFEPPIETAEHLDLELPAKNFGGEGMVRLRIPTSSIRK